MYLFVTGTGVRYKSHVRRTLAAATAKCQNHLLFICGLHSIISNRFFPFSSLPVTVAKVPLLMDRWNGMGGSPGPFLAISSEVMTSKETDFLI